MYDVSISMYDTDISIGTYEFWAAGNQFASIGKNFSLQAVTPDRGKDL